MSKVRNYTFTVNNPDWQELLDYSMFAVDYANYMIVGFETAPETGTSHFQGYVNLKQPHTFSFMKKRMPTAHIEATEGTSDQNIVYCSKGGDYWEYGERPQSGRAKWDKIVEAMKDPKSNPHLFNQYYKTYRTVKNQELAESTHERSCIYMFNWIEIPIDDVCVDISTYNGEYYVYVESQYEYEHLIRMWRRGFPTKIKRGYEIIPFNPHIVYIKTDDFTKDKSLALF